MQGVRNDLHEENWVLEPGEYGKNLETGEWFMRPPQSETFHSGMGNLNNHTVVEHNDGTITVSPSILVTGHHDKQWHGYLEHGIWREV